jgi:hypothetical protein
VSSRFETQCAIGFTTAWSNETVLSQETEKITKEYVEQGDAKLRQTNEKARMSGRSQTGEDPEPWSRQRDQR